MMEPTSYSELLAEALAYDEPVDRVEFDFCLPRRTFVQLLGAGLLISVCDFPAMAQAPNRRGGRGGRGGGQPTTVAARLHIANDGGITLLTGKVECGQGARAELTQAVAEELRVPLERINVVMADTRLVPNDGITAGSRSTPSTVPAVRQAAVAARQLLVDLAARRWDVPTAEIEVRDGKVIHAPSRREEGYGPLATGDEAAEVFKRNVPSDVSVTPINEWKTLGKSVSRPNRRDIVTGAQEYPSDVQRPGMLYGRVLRPAAYGAKLKDVDLRPAKDIDGVQVIQDGEFVGVAAANTFAAQKAVEVIAATARWETTEQISSDQLYSHLKDKARGGVPENPFADELAGAAKQLKQEYHVAYVQHAPMEPRAAVAEWDGDKLTVWTATQNPFGVRGELARAFRIGEDKVRVIVPDFGGGFGGKHSGETAIEAARLAQGAGKSVSLRWTREEEFTWAYFRPAGVIIAEAGLDQDGAINLWHFVNINSGGSAVETPYRVAKSRSQTVASEAPLRHGSYRALASTANTFARECFMDELAAAAGRDALEFRLAHLENPRLRAVLELAAEKFDWQARVAKKQPNIGVGLACGTEKGSYVAAGVEVEVNPDNGRIKVRHICQAYECGAIINPDNLMAQVKGCIVMGLGPALAEEIQFADGKVTNAAFSKYSVPRFNDVPVIDVRLLNRLDLPSAGAGETPIIAVAPAIANAVYRATGQRIRTMPIRLS